MGFNYNMLTLMLDAWTATCICGLRGIYHVVCKVLEPLDDKYYKQIIYNPYSANLTQTQYIPFKPLDLSLVPLSIRLNWVNIFFTRI